MPNGMSQEIIEVAFLLLIAFVIGCAIGYLLRYLSVMPAKQQAVAPAPSLTPAPAMRAAAPEPAARAPAPPAAPAAARTAASNGPSAAKRLAATATEPQPVDTAPAPKPAAKPARSAKPAPMAEEASVAAAAGAEGKPSALAAPRDGKKDDLRQIKGIGPKTETTLNALGVFHFDQIVAWDAKTVAWVNQHLSFSGRIERDDWIGQARNLAAGGAPLPKK